MSTKQNISLFNRKLILQALKDSFIKLNPVIADQKPGHFYCVIRLVLTTNNCYLEVLFRENFHLSIFR